MATQADRGIPLSTLAPKFLHANSTSHTWPFSAMAELIDNAYDPDVSAKQFWIDKTVVKGEECLTFMDNGNGLNNKSMHKMLSFGYSDKIAVNGQDPIGIYGNGFKSGSMRLGRDAIVFSKSKKAMCVGMLSQTYLEKIDAKQIVVPIVCYEDTGPGILYLPEQYKASLKAILEYSPFNTQEELYSELSAISSVSSAGKTGTRIIIWNLRRTSSGALEFDFERDRYDIQIPSELYDTINDGASDRMASHTPETQFSLRAYCSVLYLKPRMQIMVRGVKVKSQLIKKSLACIRKDHYKPLSLSGKRISIIFGFNTKSNEQYGFMMYHKNRLIKAYERVGCQLRADNRGVGVIGVIECNFLEPTHNKQSFLESDKYRKTINSLGIKLEEYWKEMHFEMTKGNPNSTVPMEDTMKRPDQNWVQCDSCLRWRKLPDGIDCNKLPDKWFCRMNPDPQFRSCQVEEEPEDSDDDQPSYKKPYREQEREKKRKQLIQRASCSTSSTPNASPRDSGAKPESSPKVVKLPKAVCTPAGNDGLPVITNVCSLSVTPQSVKRHHPVKLRTLKRRKLNSGNSGSVDSPVSTNSASPPAVPVVSDSDETDDDLVILETASTPKPPQAGTGVRKVKTETENESISMQLDGKAAAASAAVADSSEASVAAFGPAGGATRSPEPAPHVSSTTTQTEAPKVKTEESSQQDEARKDGTTPNARNHNSGLDPSNVEQGALKQESHEDSWGDNLRDLPMQNGVTDEVESDVYAERDALKLRVQELTCKLQEMQERMSGNVKKELSHQHTQTDETEEHRISPEEVKQEAEREKEDAARQHEERDTEVALQAEQLIQEVDEINKRKDMLLSQVESLKKEKENIAAQCEELVLRLQQQKEKEPTGTSTVVSSEQPPSDGEEPSTSSGVVCEGALKSLTELRHNIGRVLVRVVPALDLGQVNYQCNVIDEMLEAIVNNKESILGLVNELNAHI